MTSFKEDSFTRQARFILHYLFVKAEKAELDKNWTPNMEQVPIEKVPPNSNVIGSHFVYKVKFEASTVDGEAVKHMTLKSRLSINGNKDDEREYLRTAAAVVSHIGFRTLYSAACTFGLIMAKADIRGAYTQYGDAKRSIYVRPPFRIGKVRNLWLLKTLSYGIVFAGRKWQLKSDNLVLNGLKLRVTFGVPQLFVRRFTEE